ncbi:MAG: energy transducer TonB, partial [Pyrinomonadaceae bacterium]
EVRPTVASERPRPVERSSEQPTHDVRTALVASVNNPAIVPDKISNKAGEIPPVRDNMPVAIGDVNTNAEAEPGARFSDGHGPASVKVVPSKIITEEPPPVKTLTPAPEKKILKVASILNGQAKHLPNPPYPELAKRAGAQGVVMVQILINEAGKVVSARAVNGHPLLRTPAEQAAFQALFSPTMLNGEAVKVSGTITFNFMLH